MTKLAAALRALADLVDVPEPKPYEGSPYVAAGSAFEGSEHLEAQRREDAMRLIDDETQGYVLLIVREKDSGVAKIEPSIAILDHMWPAFRAALGRVEAAGRQVYNR